ncbi:MAG: DUF1700 domain-containing protein [Lachnospiraceae bacterium]|nr:DUF1700 domain-containing protein [Lachnospiraceae bacterium]
MTKQEFINHLQNSLRGQVPEGVVRENVSYYEQYFENQRARGISEEAVCESIGPPNLIARSIIEAEKHETGSAREDEEELTDDISPNSGPRFSVRYRRIPGWLGVALLILIVIFIFWLVFNMFRILIPVLVPLVLVIFAYRMIKKFIAGA